MVWHNFTFDTDFDGARSVSGYTPDILADVDYCEEGGQVTVVMVGWIKAWSRRRKKLVPVSKRLHSRIVARFSDQGDGSLWIKAAERYHKTIVLPVRDQLRKAIWESSAPFIVSEGRR